MLQCGDPTGTGTGGPGYTIPDELSGTETYGPGTLAMANTGPAELRRLAVLHRLQGHAASPRSTRCSATSPRRGVKAVQKVAAKGTDNAFGQGDGHPKTKVTITKVTTG